MANTTVLIPFPSTGQTLYATIRNLAGQIWNGSAFEAYATANIATYDIALTEQGTASKVYAFTFPAAITASGMYFVDIYVYAVAGTPAETDSGPLWRENIDWDGSAIGGTAAAVWSYATRTLTQTGASLQAVVEGTGITIQRGDTLSISLTGIGNISTRTKLWWAWKDAPNRSDSAAQLFIEETAGLQYVAGATPTASQTGSIVVTNAVTGALTITASAAATAALSVLDGTWELQMLTANGVTTLQSGDVTITQDIVLATS